MRKYVIEREIPDIGAAGPGELCQAAEKSNEVLASLAPDVQWVHSFVAEDRTFCVYLARDEEMVRRHAEISGFPATRIFEVKRMFDPTTAAKSLEVAS